MIRLGLADDHQLFRKSLSVLLSTFRDFEVVVEALHGSELQEKLKGMAVLPDIILLDVSMPVMDGFETTKWLRATYPSIRLVALSMNDQENAVREMLTLGCCAFLFKHSHPDELEKALREVYEKSFYHQNLGNLNLVKWIQSESKSEQLTPRELDFLQHSSSDLTYKEIAKKMNVSERTIDGYREALFAKLNVQSRTGMVVEAYRRGLVRL